jgi:hypothetical protein
VLAALADEVAAEVLEEPEEMEEVEERVDGRDTLALEKRVDLDTPGDRDQGRAQELKAPILGLQPALSPDLPHILDQKATWGSLHSLSSTLSWPSLLLCLRSCSSNGSILFHLFDKFK